MSLYFLTVLFMGIASAQPGTTYVSNQQLNKNFSDPDLWVGGVVPPEGASVTIVNSAVTMDLDMTLGTVTINSGSLNLASRTLTITDRFINYQQAGVISGTSTVIFNSTVADNNSAIATIGGSEDIIFYNVELPDGSVVDFGSGGGSNSETYITNRLKMDGGSVAVNSPIYGTASTLLYNDTHASIGVEWTAGLNAGKGVPYHVSVGDGASLDFGASSSNYTCLGNFVVNSLGASLNLGEITGELTVQGDLAFGMTKSVSLTLPSMESDMKVIVLGDLTLGSNTTSIGTKANFAIGGDFTCGGSGISFGTLELIGSVSQVVSGGGLVIDEFIVDNGADDVITGNGDVIINAVVDITPGGFFDPVDGSVSINSSFTMNSDATGTARIATLANSAMTSDVSGDITFERYIPANLDGPSWLASGNYVVGATRADWAASFGSDLHLVFDWDETHAVDVTDASGGANAWTIISDETESLHSDGIGYAVYTASGSSPTLAASGSYNIAQQDLTLSFSNGAHQGGGWHILSNPFPSPISGSEFLSDNSGLISRYYMYDNSNDIFKTDLTGAPAIIDVGQAFWVQVSGAGTVSFELDQVTEGTNSFMREVDPLDIGIVGVRVGQEGGLFGHAFVRLHGGATPEWDWELDASRRASGNTNAPEIFSSLENGHQLLINAISLNEVEQTVIPFTVETGAEGTVEVKAEPDFNLPQGWCAFIEDTETGARVSYHTEMSLVVDLEPQTTYADRFELVLMEAPVFESTSSYCAGGTVSFIGENVELWTISWSDTTGIIGGTDFVTGLFVGDYIFEATNPINSCHTESFVSIEEVCLGDFNFNGERDISDLLLLLVNVQGLEVSSDELLETDCDCDGVMTTLDLLTFLPHFGNDCD